MATNKGLLFGAALANGVNAFLDAREKGDLQRQRQALATVEQQMKQQQLANLQTTGKQKIAELNRYNQLTPLEILIKDANKRSAVVGANVAESTQQDLINQASEEFKRSEFETKRSDKQASLADEKLKFEQFINGIKMLGLEGLTGDALFNAAAKKLTEGSDGQKSIARNALGITTASELAELTDTYSNQLLVARTGVQDSQQAYIDARKALTEAQKITETNAQALLKAKAASEEVLSPAHLTALLKVNAVLPEGLKYKDLDVDALNALVKDMDTKGYTYRQITNPDETQSIIAISGTEAEFVTIEPDADGVGLSEGEGLGVKDQGLVPEDEDAILEAETLEEFDQLRGEGQKEFNQKEFNKQLEGFSDKARRVLKWKEEGSKSEGPDFRLETTLRKEFNAQPVVKAWAEIDMLYGNALAAYDEALGGRSRVFVDQALINIFNKMLDYKSVVREGEYARTADETSFLSRIVSLTNRVYNGGSLPPKDRKAAMVMIGKFYKLHRQRYLQARSSIQKTIDSYNQRAGYKKFNRDDVIGNVPMPTEKRLFGAAMAKPFEVKGFIDQAAEKIFGPPGETPKGEANADN